jgi:hypothetical protein
MQLEGGIVHEGSRVVYATNLVWSTHLGLQCKERRGVPFKSIEKDSDYPVLLQLQGSDSALDQ